VVRGVARQRSRMLKCYDSTKNHENLVQMGNGEQQFRVGLSQVADWALAFSGLNGLDATVSRQSSCGLVTPGPRAAQSLPFATRPASAKHSVQARLRNPDLFILPLFIVRFIRATLAVKPCVRCVRGKEAREFAPIPL